MTRVIIDDFISCQKSTKFHYQYLTFCVAVLFGFTFGCLFFWVQSSDKLGYLRCSRIVEREANLSLCSSDEKFHTDNQVTSDLRNKVKIVCLIMTNARNHKKKASAVKFTWGKRCNRLIFMSSKGDSDLPAIKLKLKKKNRSQWGRTRAALAYVYKHHFNEIDWLLKVNHDTYVVMENLRYFLMSANKSKAVYFGHKLKSKYEQGYMSANAGYVLSREALRLFVEHGLSEQRPEECSKESEEKEEIVIGRCMDSLSVEAGESRDDLLRGRFFPLSIKSHLIPEDSEEYRWYTNYSYYPFEKGMNCCSDTAISFHNTNLHRMYVYEYILYHLKPFGVHSEYNELISKK